jgi:hypothetical protein
MKITFEKWIVCIVLIMSACGQKTEENNEQTAGDPIESEGNQALYEEVMKVHDEVMPKMNDMYKLKEELKNKIANTPALVEEKKKEIEGSILKLDSASESMMVWMRHFNPIPDSLGQEKAREYLENEMEKVKKVREDIYEAIEKAKAEN